MNLVERLLCTPTPFGTNGSRQVRLEYDTVGRYRY